jgi:hypothetical protein
MSNHTEWRSDQPSEEPSRRRNSASPKTRTMADLLFLPETERSLMNWLLRQQRANLSEIAAHLDQSESATQTLLNELIAQSFIQKVEQDDICCYQPNLVSRKGRNVPGNIWDALK